MFYAYASFVFMSVFSQLFLSFMSGNFSEFAFSSAGHLIFSLRYRLKHSMNE